MSKILASSGDFPTSPPNKNSILKIFHIDFDRRTQLKKELNWQDYNCSYDLADSSPSKTGSIAELTNIKLATQTLTMLASSLLVWLDWATHT